MYTPWGGPTKKVETCRSSSALNVKNLCSNAVQLLVYSWILTVSALIWMAYRTDVDVSSYVKSYCNCLMAFLL